MTEKPFASVYSEYFQEQLDQVSDKLFERIDRSIALLETMPGLGREYEPEYEADLPPFSRRFMVVPRTTKCLYFTVDEDARVLRFFLLDDTRRNPQARFMGIQNDW